jgi:hypothetical protein
VFSTNDVKTATNLRAFLASHAMVSGNFAVFWTTASTSGPGPSCFQPNRRMFKANDAKVTTNCVSSQAVQSRRRIAHGRSASSS